MRLILEGFAIVAVVGLAIFCAVGLLVGRWS